MIQLETNNNGVILSVRAQSGASRDKLRVWQDGMLRVAVTQAAEKGKANRALRAVIAKALSLRRSQLELISGAARQTETFSGHRNGAVGVGITHRGRAGNMTDSGAQTRDGVM